MYKLLILEEFGIEMFEELSIVFFRGGEIEVFRRLDEYMEREVCILWFEFGSYIGRRC